jgi:hypothetical protein
MSARARKHPGLRRLALRSRWTICRVAFGVSTFVIAAASSSQAGLKRIIMRNSRPGWSHEADAAARYWVVHARFVDDQVQRLVDIGLMGCIVVLCCFGMDEKAGGSVPSVTNTLVIVCA